MLGVVLVVGFRATINSSVTATKPRTQIGKYSKAWLPGTPEGAAIKVGWGQWMGWTVWAERGTSRGPPALVLWTSLRNLNGRTLPEQGLGLLGGPHGK